ncbi:hypothetical protein Tco_1273723 [Tanacetum coccineum]
MLTFWAKIILIQGVAKRYLSLSYHYTYAKDIWDNVKMLLEGSELTKDDHVSQLYDDFEHFCQHKGETIYDYYKTIQSNTSVDPLALTVNVAPSRTIHNHPTSQSSNIVPPSVWKGSRALRRKVIKELVAEEQTSSNPRNQATVQDSRVVVQNVQGRQNRGQGNNARGAGTAGYRGSLNRVGNANPVQVRQNGVTLDEEQLLFLAGGQDNAVDEDADEQPVQDLALNVDNVFQANNCDAFDFDVDKAPTAQTMFMANLSSADPVYDEADPSYDSDILSEVHDQDHYQDAVCEHHEEHEMHDDYVKDNAFPVVQSNVSSVSNDAYMMIYNDMCEPHAQSVSKTTWNIVVDNSLTAKLETYKEQVKLYKRRARFELTEREQKIDEQLRIVITDRNIKEEKLKKELHSVKLQLASTINHNKSMVEEVMSLKKDFKQKENKYLEEFLDMKALKQKVEDILYKQDQSLQTVHMLCKPKPYYNELNKVAICYKNPLCLTRAKQVQPALYNGYEIVKNNHVLAIVHNTEDTLEIAKITRRKMYDKMKDPECVTHKVKIAPPDYFKENYLATFTPQKQLTPDQSRHHQDESRSSQRENHCLKTNQSIDSISAKYTCNACPNGASNKDPKLEAEVDQHVPDSDSVFVIENMKVSIQGKDNAIKKLRMQISQLNETRSEADRTLDFRTLDFQITQLTEKINVLQEQNELLGQKMERLSSITRNCMILSRPRVLSI